MSEPSELSLDLEKAFLPAWAQQPSDAARYAKYEGTEGAGERRGPRSFGDRPPRRDGPGGPGGRPGFGGPRPGGPGGRPGFGGPRPGGPGGRPGFGGPRPGGPGGPRPGGPGGPSGEGTGLKWDPNAAPGQQRGPRRNDRRDFEPEPLIPVDVELRPEAAGVNSLGRQIKLSGRAYPLLEVAGLVIQKPDRYEITFRTMKGKDGKVLQPLFVCSLDDSVWLSEAEAAQHVLKGHFDTFYQTEKLPCDPPKGVWTLVAQFDEVILGPPNYHGYQEKLREVHAQRARGLPFEVFKSRVRIVKDEAIVKQWIDGQSSRLEYTAINVPEALKFGTLAEVEAHFRATHLVNVVKSVDSWRLNREQAGPRLPEPLHRVLRVTLERERKFPIRTMTALSAAFAGAGLQFFKRDKTIVHVAIARPHYLDLETSYVSNNVRRIIEFIDANANATRKKLVEALAPTPEAPAAAPAPVVEAVAPSTEPAAEGAPAAEAAPAAPASPRATPEQQAVLTDLHWLVHQGHVIEFANGKLETAKKPLVKPEPAPKPERAPKPGAKTEAAAAPVEAAAPAVSAEAAAPVEAAAPLETAAPAVVDEAGLQPIPAPNPGLAG
ncbi:MAG TPA: hypothetical protein VMB21_06585 [Candidatus Limnocylindria bacterium]|nr:hypothetical protein [Candidatus Limnocylindria bacterium]